MWGLWWFISPGVFNSYSCPYWAFSNLWTNSGFPTPALVPSKAAVLESCDSLQSLLVSSILRVVACFVTSLYWKKNVDFSVGFKFYLLSGSNGNFQASHMPYQKLEVHILRNVFLYHKLKNLHRVIKHMQIQYHIEQNCVAYSVNYYFSLSSYTACIFISSHVA